MDKIHEVPNAPYISGQTYKHISLLFEGRPMVEVAPIVPWVGTIRREATSKRRKVLNSARD